MRRIVSVLAVAAIVAAMLVATALPVFAQEAAPQANCLGEEAVLFNLREDSQGSGGQRTATYAQDTGGVGTEATSDCLAT